jgi:DnaK suppressor protein
MNVAATERARIKEILERKQVDLGQALRERNGIVIEKSADAMDEIQYASERDLAIRNADRDSALVRNIRDALRRLEDGSYGLCIECELSLSPKRLVALPWAARCIECQEAADRNGQEKPDSLDELLAEAA